MIERSAGNLVSVAAVEDLESVVRATLKCVQ